MVKIQNFSEILLNLPFIEFDFNDLYRGRYRRMGFEVINQKLPIHEMVESFG